MGGTSPEKHPVQEGDVLAGRYRVERVLAAGGMGVVVAARHIQLNHRVAVKVLTHNAGSSQSNARFLTEAKASALLRSDHVVHVSDVGTLDSGHLFMVMELLEGADLAEVVEREGPLPMATAIDYVLQACVGLAEAHTARIVHRDLKPGNLFRTRKTDGSEIIKVLDFGVSKALSQDVRAEGTVTTTDAVFGSPLYMSPEQMKSAAAADERSDIWSLGVVLYELLTGQMPFEAESMAGLAVKIAIEPPIRLTKVLPGAPPELEAVIFKCLEKDPAKRYPNAAELAADLEPLAPASRIYVERIQRLILGSTNPPREAVSAPSLPRVIGLGAETLGPVNDPSIPALAAAQPKSRMLAVLLAFGIVLALAAVTVFIVKRPKATASSSVAVTSAMTQAPTPSIELTVASPVPIAPNPTAAIAAQPTFKPRAPHPVESNLHAIVSSSAATAPMPLSSGISRDRK